MDTLVLGCTHYIFIKEELRALLGPEVQLIDTGGPGGAPDAALAGAAAAFAPRACADSPDACAQAHQIRLMTTGSLPSLQAAAQRWLQLPASCCATVRCSPLQQLIAADSGHCTAEGC